MANKKPTPKSQKEISNNLINPYSNPETGEGVDPSIDFRQFTPKSQKGVDHNRAEKLSHTGDTHKPFSVNLQDVDEAVLYYFENVIKPFVIQNGERIPVPLVYGSPERFKAIQKDGIIRDKNGKLMMPIAVFKRDDITKNRSITRKLDANDPHLYTFWQTAYNKKNSYSNFDVLNNRVPNKQFIANVVPDYVTLTYSFIVQTYYVEQLNKIVESINYASDSYWGDPERFKFKARIDSFATTNELNQGTNRVVRSTFTLKINGYIVPDVVQKDLNSIKKYNSKSKLTFGVEIDNLSPTPPSTPPLPAPVCRPATVINSDNSFSQSIFSGATGELNDINYVIEDEDGNVLDTLTFPAMSDQVIELESFCPKVWWERPEGWLPMPTINEGDNKFAGLYAVFEDDFNAVAILLSGGNHSIDWGDGATDSGSGANQTYNHVYDYSTISGAVLVSDDGRNYKQVMVEFDFDSTTLLVQIDRTTTPTTGTNLRPQNWLDVAISSTRIFNLSFDASNNNQYRMNYLERINIIGDLVRLRNAKLCPNLKVVDYNWFNQIRTEFGSFNDFRADANGTPVSINAQTISGPSSGQQFAFQETLISKVGNITDLLGESQRRMFFINSNIQEIGDINIPSATQLDGAFYFCYKLYSIGTITVGVSLLNLSLAFFRAFSLKEIIFAGDMSGVNNTNQTFQECNSLRRLILPNITVGFDIRWSQITGQNLQDLFDSIGIANGTQTITLPNFTSGEPTGIATGKGYTIAYA